MRVFASIALTAVLAFAGAGFAPKPAAAPATTAVPPAPPSPEYGSALPGMPQPFTAPEYALGSVKAPQTVIEYLSAACPHCAHFDAQVFPAIKAKYVDTGKVRWVVREFLAGEPSFAAAGFVLARCTGPAKYWATLEAVFRAQDGIFRSGDIRAGLLGVAKAQGLDEKAFDACVAQDAAYKAMDARHDAAVKAGIDSTPTFFIDGRKYDKGAVTLAEFEAALARR